MIVTTADLYKIAYGKYAIGTYNVNNLEQTLGMFRGCVQSQAPFIIQLSKGARQCADFIAHKNEKLGSAGRLSAVRKALATA